jgi:hypothetical protein
VRKWLRHAENLSGIKEKVIHICEPKIGRNLDDEEEMRSTRYLINYQEGRDKFLDLQMGKEMGSSRDLMDFQEGRTGIPIFQMGMGNMRLSGGLGIAKESFVQQGMLTDEMETKERPHLYEYSFGVADRVNEDDENLNTSITEEENQRSVLIVRGNQIFLPNNPT